MKKINNSYRTNKLNFLENKRLEIQSEKLKEVEYDLLKSLISKYKKIDVLDIGCNTGKRIYEYFGKNPKTRSIIGVDLNLSLIKFANEKYGNRNNKFYCYDIEEKEFFKFLDKSSKNFNIVFISMVLLHLEQPKEFLKKIKKYLTDNGTIFIVDIDDRLTSMTEDKYGDFQYLWSLRKYIKEMLGMEKLD